MHSSILSSQAPKTNSLTLVKGRRVGLFTIGPTLFTEDHEHGEIEEMHYLMVRVEKMKKALLHKVEGKQQIVKEYINMIDEQDEALYRVDPLVGANTVGPDTITEL